jgi:aspartate-semialdehyde dehydrogenase
MPQTFRDFQRSPSDLTQTGRAGTIFLKGISNSSSSQLVQNAGYFVNPHPAVSCLSNVLQALRRKYEIVSSTVTLLEPASERGAAAIEELQEADGPAAELSECRQQTVQGADCV